MIAESTAAPTVMGALFKLLDSSPKKLTTDQADFVNYQLHNATLMEIANDLGVSYEDVANHIKKNNITLPQLGKPTKRAIELYAEKNDLEILWIDYSENNRNVMFICDCGRTFKKRLDYIHNESGPSKCNHCSDPMIGDVFGSLVVESIQQGCRKGSLNICRCTCGTITEPIASRSLLSGARTTCGNCNTTRNGVRTSATALKLHTLIEEITCIDWQHNYNISGVGNVDLAAPELQVCIEFNSHAWHRELKNNTEMDLHKLASLLASNWKVIVIESDGNELPSEYELCDELIDILLTEYRNITIRLDSWNVRTKKYANKCSKPAIEPIIKQKYDGFGESKTLIEWNRDSRCNMTYTTLWKRIKRMGMSIEQALTTELGLTESNKHKRLLTAFGETKSKSAWLKDPRCKVKKSTLRGRLKRGNMTNEEAISTPPIEHGDFMKWLS